MRIALSLILLVFVMLGLSFLSVPLYKMFCAATGFGGTTQRASSIPTASQIVNRDITVMFNADISPDLPWSFVPEQRQMTLKLGQTGLMNYKVKNSSNEPVIGVAVYNVTPQKVGLYFAKVQCFCFEEQIIGPGQEVNMPVYFYVDPALHDDPNMSEVKQITLSYSFFRANSNEYRKALDQYYRMIESLNASHSP